MKRIAWLLLGIFCLLMFSGCATTTLYQAATLNDIAKVQSMLDRGTDVDSSEVTTDRTPLMAAAAGGHIELAKLLVEKGANANYVSKSGDTPLIFAAVGGNIELVKMLIEKGANVNQVDEVGFTPLMAATVGGNIELVKLLVEQGANVNYVNKNGDTPLMFAGGKLEIAMLFMEKGANVNNVSNYGNTPLFMAAMAGNLEIVKLFYEKGAKVNAVNSNGETPLSIAAKFDKAGAAKFLIEKGADPNHASKVGVPTIPKEYFDIAVAEPVKVQWENQNIEINNGSTPLILAASRGFTETVRILIDSGADPSVRGNDGKTALDWAKKRNHGEICKALETRETAKKLELLSSKDPAVLRAYLDAHPDEVSSIKNSDLRLRYTGPAALRITDIAHLVKAGTKDALIIAKINSAGGPYKNFSVSEMSALKNMGLSDEVVAAMIEVTTTYDKEQKLLAEQKHNQASRVPVQVAQQVQAPAAAPESNMLADCVKLAAALKSCDLAGGFLTMGCKAIARSQYNCPSL